MGAGWQGRSPAEQGQSQIVKEGWIQRPVGKAEAVPETHKHTTTGISEWAFCGMWS